MLHHYNCMKIFINIKATVDGELTVSQAPSQALYMFHIIYSYNSPMRDIYLVLILLMIKLRPSKSLGLIIHLLH